MKKLILALICFSAMQSSAQVSDRSAAAILTSTCANATTTCDTAGITVFGQYSDVLGPQTVELNTQNYGMAQVTVHGTYTGSTLFFEFSDDGGTNWYPEICARSDANIQESTEAVGSNASQGWECSVGAAKKFRVRQSALGSGGPTITVTLTAGLIEPAPTVAAIGAAATGTAVVGGPILMGTQDNSSNLQAVRSANAQGDAQTGNQLLTGAGYSWNGANFDRNRDTKADSGARVGMLEAAPVYTFSNIAAATTGTAVKATAGILHSVTINTYVASATIRILNLASAGCTGSPTTPDIALITLPGTVTALAPQTVIYDVAASAGICVVASGATDITLSFD